MALLGRDTSISGPFPKGVLLLETLQGKEALGSPFRYDLTLLSQDPAIPATKMLGQALTVEIALDNGNKRYFHGIVTFFAKMGLAMRHTRYAAVLCPKLSLFDHTRECRVFNDAANYDADPEAKKSGQTALSIVTEVLKNRRLDIESGGIQAHTYRDRKYCVQYRESDLNFVQRLLEEEGIYYFFKHEDGQAHDGARRFSL
jgi:type VI secretion system secreted protein VgrG